jgi:hypothetical protein
MFARDESSPKLGKAEQRFPPTVCLGTDVSHSQILHRAISLKPPHHAANSKTESDTKESEAYARLSIVFQPAGWRLLHELFRIAPFQNIYLAYVVSSTET